MTSERVDDLAAWESAATEYADQPQVDWFDDFLNHHLGDLQGKTALDLGCGHGWFTNELTHVAATSSASMEVTRFLTSPGPAIPR